MFWKSDLIRDLGGVTVLGKWGLQIEAEARGEPEDQELQ